MANIIKHGKYRIITCECGCEYSFEVFELDENNQLECPECGALNTAQVKESTEN